MSEPFRLPRIALLTLMLALFLGLSAQAQSRSETVRFPRGVTSTVLDDSIRAGESIDYILRAEAGQRLGVSLRSANAFVSFDVFLPGSVAADFVGQTSGNSYGARLRKGGDILVRVQLGHTLGGRAEEGDFRLTLALTGATAPTPTPTPPTDSVEKPFWQVSGLRRNDTLNMRSGPGTGFRILDTFANGTVLRNYGCAVNERGATWCEVSRTARGAQSGWVSSRYLVALDKTPPAPTPAPPRRAEVKCSVILPLLDRTCRAAVVRNGATAELSLTHPGAATWRKLILRDGRFSSAQGEQISVQSLGSQYLIVLGNADYYLVPASLLQPG